MTIWKFNKTQSQCPLGGSGKPYVANVKIVLSALFPRDYLQL